MSQKGATVIVLVFTFMVLGALACVLILGTMFFDDPHASYDRFLSWFERAALVVIAITSSCLAFGRLLLQCGFRRSALVLTLLPPPAILAYAIYLGS